MGKILFPTTLILIIAVLIGVMPTDAEAKVFEDTVRLHILANSDSKEDQEVKLKVRDRVLEVYGKEISDAESSGDAEAKLTSMIPMIKETAECVVRECGYSYSVNVIIGKEEYDTRDYEDFSLPRGVYTSLRIEIGDAAGKNWWCVMYPPLCLGASIDGAGYSGEVTRLIKDKTSVKFKILELLSDSF